MKVATIAFGVFQPGLQLDLVLFVLREQGADDADNTKGKSDRQDEHTRGQKRPPPQAFQLALPDARTGRASTG